MASVKAKFRPSIIEGKEGTVYYQIIQDRVIRQLKTDYRIFADEWNDAENNIIIGNSERSNLLHAGCHRPSQTDGQDTHGRELFLHPEKFHAVQAGPGYSAV